MGGTLLALNAVASHRRAKAMESAAKAQADGMSAQAEANKQTEYGRRQERFKNAIEHLGATSAAIRMGGTYELYNLAKETPELRQTVLDIFCTHIRQVTSEETYREQHATKPSLEIQDLLSLAFVRDPDVFSGCRIELSESWLNGADLREARLWKANLRGVRLFDGLLDRVRMQGASLVEADLRGARLSHASLHGANLFQVRMEACCLLHGQLQGATIAGGHLTGANLGGAQLQGADLSSASMYGANLVNAGMQAAALGFSYAQGAIFRDTDLRGARATDWSPSVTFADRINEMTGVDADHSGVAYAGIMRNRVQQLVTSIEVVDKHKAEILREQLAPHIDQPLSWGLPEDAPIVTGAICEEEANRWIVQYEDAFSEVSASG